MGILERVLGNRESGVPVAPVSTEQTIPVVGESSYQPAIRAACGWTKPQDIRFECLAELCPEPWNPHDANAICVRIGGRRVGYLSREDAAEVGPHVQRAIKEQGTPVVRAMIRGRKDGDTPNLGVWVYLRVPR